MRGAWIEIRLFLPMLPCGVRRTPCGVRGLKFDILFKGIYAATGRTPCGVRGLKYRDIRRIRHHRVAPHAGCVD